MARLLRWSFYAVLVRAVVLLLLGLNVRGRHRLPQRGPALVVANHNSHLDTMVLMTLLPLAELPHIHPVAAADYFLRNPLLAWFATRIVGIIPLPRRPARGVDPLAPCHRALEQGEILILFPEGTRGEPEQRSGLKGGVSRLAVAHPGVPVVPVFLHGLGKALPKGEGLLVPFFCDVHVGEPLRGITDRRLFMRELEGALERLEAEARISSWE